MDEWILGLLGLMVGAVLGAGGVALAWAMRRARAHARLADAETRARLGAEQLEERQDELEELRGEHERIRAEGEDARRQLATSTERVRALEHAEERLRESFRATGAEALQANAKQFLELAETRFRTLMAESRGDVEKRHLAIDNLVRPIRDLLERQGAALGELENKRDVAYRGLEEQIKQIIVSNEKLDRETSRLVTALRRPEQRGRWGEMQLRNVVELAGMTEHCDFQEQVGTDDATTRDRPDMLVRVPGGGNIVVDSKVALDAYLDTLEPDSDRIALLKKHADLVERHFRRLATKRYWEQFDRTPKLVVMFMPLESALVAALEVKPHLHTEAMEGHVLIATPTLLVALLRAVAYGWQQEAITENARDIAKVGSELYDRVATFTGHFEQLGLRLGKATEAYNSAVGSLESRILASTRKLKELSATSKADIDTPAPIEIEPRAVTSIELKGAAPVDEKKKTTKKRATADN